MKRLDIATLGLVLFALPGWAQDFDAVEIQTVHASSNVYMLVGAGGNIGVSIGDDGVFVIDDQFAPLSDKIMAAIEDLSDDDVRFLVNTHFHGDHVGGNEAFAGAGAIIVAHD
ncbi:MAG TPA: MBL fold metallo-hydrolase, partial [Gammaproteobacteria bacterium]